MYSLPLSYATYTAAAPAGSGSSGVSHEWKNGSSFGFNDVLDTLNPLQHIPIVGTLYRWITGDEPGDVARTVGDGLYGGVAGFALGAIASAIKDETGKDPGEMVMALFGGEDSAQVKLGSAAVPAASAAAAMPASAPATPAAAAAPSVAAHRSLLPLFNSPPPAAAAAASGSPEQSFLSQNAALQRSLHGERAALPARPITAPIPLQLSGPQLPQRFSRQPVAAASAAPSVAAPPAAPLSNLSTLPQNPTVEIPQRMMDALDKYARMQQEREQRGQQVDVVP